MAIKATGQITIVDLSDSSQLSVYLIANLPKTQILDLSTGTANPDWTQENLEITPNILLNQANIPLTDTNLTVTYKRKDGSGAESSLVAGETVTNKVLKVNKNILKSSDAKSITYICYVSYLDTKLNLTVSAQADINFSLVTNGTEGVGVNEIKEYYYSSTSATELAGGEWSETYPGWESGKYIWTKSIITYTDNTTKETTPICVSGADGTDGTSVTVSSTETTYQKSSSPTTIPTGTWSPTVVATDTTNKYLWTKVVVTFSDGKTATSYSVSSTMDSVAIGGRNLLLDSRHIQLYSNNNDSYPITSTKMIENDKEFIRYKRSSTTLSPTLMSLYNAISITNITEYLTNLETTFSFLIRCSHPTTTSLRAYIRTDDNYEFSSNSKAYAIGTEWTRVFVTATITQEYDATSPDVVICFCPYNITIPSGQIDNFYIDICEWKIEKGNIATDWTPAPEDTDDRITQVEGDLTGKYNDLVNNDIAIINDKLAQEIADTKTMKEDLGVISQQATTLVSLVDENEKKTQTLTQTVSNMLLSGESLDISFDRTKGVNLLKNSVMQQHKTAVASGVIKADFWLNKNLEEDYFSNVYYNEEALVRKTTVCGNSFQIRTKTTDEVKYDFILSSPIDLKENVENLLLAYKIKGNISAGNCFVGLVFYKHLIDQPNGLSFTSSSSNPYITNAYYVPINCYSAAEGTNIKKINASFTQDYIYKTMPLATPEAYVTKEVNETLVAEEGQIELTYLPQTGSNIVLVSPSGVQGVVGASDSRLVTLPAALLEETIVTATYNRSIETFKTATSTTDAQTKTNSMPNTETTICYNPSSKKIYVYNPFTKSYYLSNNLYDNTSSSSNIDTVRVIIGICGATISSDFIGNVEIADLKLEYDSTSIYWTQNLDESYSKKYRMDEKGFSISSDQNMMFIDENQIAAYQLEETTTVEGETIKEPDLDNPVFQISGAETQLQKTIIYDELKISNRTKSEDGAFVFKQLQTESGDWYFLFY